MRLNLSLFVLFLSLLAVVQCLPGTGGRSTGKSARQQIERLGGQGTRYGMQSSLEKEGLNNTKTAGKTSTSRGGFGLSAWGLVALIVSVIVCSMGAYYFIIFYPLMCKKERNYDIMELSAV